jgi:predicted SnoaL-like aldol condensation-catalyzing enzyme
MTSTETARRVVQRWTNEVWNQGHVELVGELVHDPYLRHEADGSTHLFTLADSRERVVRGRQAWPDVRVDLVALVAEDEEVITHWVLRRTDPATGKPATTTGMERFRVTGGKIAEVWTTPGFDGEW